MLLHVELGAASAYESLGLDGILGLPLFSGCTFTVDYGSKIFLLETEPLVPDAGHTVPLRVDGWLLYLPVRLASEERWALLDTGSNGSLSVPEELWHALPRTTSTVVESAAVSGYTIEGPRTAALERLDGVLQIAGQEFPNPWMSLHPADELVVGGGVLSGCSVTVDLGNRLLRLRRGAPRRAEG